MRPEAFWSASLLPSHFGSEADGYYRFLIRGLWPGRWVDVEVQAAESDLEVWSLKISRSDDPQFETMEGKESIPVDALPDPIPIGTDDLRALPMRALKRYLFAQIPRVQQWAEDYEADRPQRRRGRPPMRQEKLEAIARLRIDAERSSELSPWQAFLALLDQWAGDVVPEGTAKTWLRRARQEGYLAPGNLPGPRLQQKERR